MATYVNDLRLKEIATGDEAGTWGTSTNTNLELIAEAFSFGTEAITTNANTHTTTIADGSTDPGRSIFLKYTGALDSDCTITIGPNTVSKLWLIENATTDSGSSGPYNIIIKQGTGATVTIPNSHTKAIYSDGAGSGGAMVDAFTDLNLADTVTISGSTPTLTIGDAGAEDTKIVFDGNAQDFYIGLDDSADDLVIGKGSAVGTTPAIEIDENLDIKFAESIGVGQAASSTTGDIAAQTMSLTGTTPTLTLGDGGEEDVAIKFNGVKDFYIANDDSADKLVIGEGSTVGTNNILTITDDTVTLGDGAAADTALVFDGNAQDYYIGLDDSADQLIIGNGSTVGSSVAISVDSSENVFVGSGTSNGISGGTAGLQVSGSGFKGIVSASRHDNNAFGSSLMLGKSRNTTVGSNTIVQDDDVIGAVSFFADDGTNLDSRVAEIVANVDGTPGENDTPGRLTISTTADGAASPTERVRVDANGDFLVRQTASAIFDTNTGGDVRQFWGNQFSGANNTASKVAVGSGTGLGLVGGATQNASSKFILNSYIGFANGSTTAGSEKGSIQFFTSLGGAAGTIKMEVESDGNIQTGGANISVFTGTSSITLADDATYSMNSSGTGGACLVAVYESGSGDNALFHCGFNGVAVLNSANNAFGFANNDTDGKICIIGSGHSLTFKNRTGLSRTFFINVFGGGNTGWNL